MVKTNIHKISLENNNEEYDDDVNDFFFFFYIGVSAGWTERKISPEKVWSWTHQAGRTADDVSGRAGERYVPRHSH